MPFDGVPPSFKPPFTTMGIRRVVVRLAQNDEGLVSFLLGAPRPVSKRSRSFAAQKNRRKKESPDQPCLPNLLPSSQLDPIHDWSTPSYAKPWCIGMRKGTFGFVRDILVPRTPILQFGDVIIIKGVPQFTNCVFEGVGSIWVPVPQGS